MSFLSRILRGSARRANTSLTRKAKTQPSSNDRDVASQKSTRLQSRVTAAHRASPQRVSPGAKYDQIDLQFPPNGDDNTTSSYPRAGTDMFFDVVGVSITLVSQATFRLDWEVKQTADAVSAIWS